MGASERAERHAMPQEVTAVFKAYLTADLATLTGAGTPVTWPVLPIYEPTGGRFAVMTSIGLPAKALNARRDPRVSLLFSDPLGSGLDDPPSVLIKGHATVTDSILTSLGEIENDAMRSATRSGAIDLFRRQPTVRLYLSNSLVRRLMDWYFIRLLITIEPHTVSWGWGDPASWEVSHVG